jgi:UDP-GlcNAc:undecaprenyl-phosphate GlcNAc-1-phosphate transferase
MSVAHFTLLVVAFVSSVILTAIARVVATRIGLVDQPDAHRKMHVHSTPLGGGIAVLLSVLITIGAAWFAPSAWGAVIGQSSSELAFVAMAVALLAVVGLIDDFKAIRARQKLLGQILACLVAMCSGLVVYNVHFFGYDLQLGLLAWPITLFWLLGAINSVNLIDGADGLAATVGVILSTTLAFMALMTGHQLEAIMALALAGALLGFLVFNFPPATIFLGDAGSMVIGLLLGVLAIRCALKGPATYAMMAPLAIWAVPAFDTGLAILRRKLTGRSIAATDRGHLHHCLLRRGFGNRQMLVWVAVLCLITATGAIVSLRRENELFAVAGVGITIAIMVLTRVFGHAEAMLVANSVRNFSASFVRPVWRSSNGVHNSAVRLQGDRNWDSLWELLIRVADDVPLYRIRLNLNLPWLHESYHASWEREPRLQSHELWRVELPLSAGGRQVGSLAVAGRNEDGNATVVLAKLSRWMQNIDDHLSLLMDAERAAQSAGSDAPSGKAEGSSAPPAPAAGRRLTVEPLQVE